MAEKKNALAELAEDLEILKVILENEHHPKGIQVADKAMRIVAELAKVEERKEYATKIPLSDATVLLRRNLSEMYYKCREIAEEGSK